MPIRIKRAYLPAEPDDGVRILVDRLWPRGLTREKLSIETWMKEIAPSNEVRKAFCHDPALWDTFISHYFEELDHQPELVSQLRNIAANGTLTLVYGARDEVYNQAAALKQYLEKPD